MWFDYVFAYQQAASDDRFAFLAEWYDPRAALMRKYQLLYYPSDSSVEMVMASFFALV